LRRHLKDRATEDDMKGIIINLIKSFKERLLSSQGNILVYIVLTMVIFGVLGVTMVSLFSTSISSSATQNDTRRATYLSEAGTRYAMSEMLSGDFSKTAIDDLNDNTEYTLDPTSKFWINVFSPWFELNAALYDFGTDGSSIPLKVPEGRIPSGYLSTIPGGGTIPGSDPDFFLVNYDYFPTTTPPTPPDTAISLVDAASSGSDTTLQYTLADDFVASRDEQICMAVAPFSGGQDIPSQGYLDLMPVARNIFPPLGGTFQIQRRNFFYSKRDDSLADRVRLTGVFSVGGEESLGDITVASTDPVILSPRNRLIVSRGRSGEVEFGDNIRYATGFSDVSVAAAQSLKPDIEFDEEANLPSVLSQVEQGAGVVNVYDDPGNKYLSLSASGGSFGAVWFRDTRSIGGIRNFCDTGGCFFNIGFRAFFIISNYTGTDGDGFTFSILNNSNNDIGSVGGDISLSELLAYAGDSRKVPSPTLASDFQDGRSGLGLQAPKMAVEFDGKRNNQSQTICLDATTVNLGSRFDPDFSGSDRDVVQYVFWGRDSLINAPCRVNTLITPNTNKTYDDNRHDTVSAIWVYNSGSTRLSSPAVDSRNAADVRIYTGRSSNNTGDRLDKGRLIRLQPSDGSEVWTRNPDSTPDNDDDIDSSPAVDSSGDIYIGNDSALISRYNSNGTRVWFNTLDSNIEGKPFVSEATSRVYVVTDNGTLYSLRRDTGAVVWFYDIGPSAGSFDYASSPVAAYDTALAPGENLIYVGSQDDSLYVVRDAGASAALVRQFSLPSGPIRSTPAINPVNGYVYFGSDDNNLWGVPANGTTTSAWAVGTGGDVVSSPAVTGDGRTVYVGSNNGRLYIIALNADGSINNTQTYPPSGDSAIGAIQSSPTIASDGAIIFGSDDGHLYALNPDRTLRWKYPAVGSIGAVRSKPAIGPDGIIYFSTEDGRMYAIDPALNDPPNDPGLYLTSAQLDPTGTYTNNWFTEGPWAVRLEVQRSITPNGSGNYDYTLKTWMKKCQNADCLQDVNGLSLLGGFFQNTRFEYDWTTAGITPMTQTIELSNTPDSFHDRFDRFLFGFTSASTAAQTIEIRKFQLSFIRPNDPVVSD
jgi:outer membrane protein assembly factor BamB